MSKGRLVIAAVVVEGRTHAGAAREFGVSRSWVIRLVGRWRVEGDAAFDPRSRRLRTSPTETPDAVVELIYGLRRQCVGTGLDTGPETIRWHLNEHHAIDDPEAPGSRGPRGARAEEVVQGVLSVVRGRPSQ